MSRVFPLHAVRSSENGKEYVEFPGNVGIMLADHFDTVRGFSPVGWYASEKYDGLRGVWTGSELVARPSKKKGVLKGKVFTYVPQAVLDMLPPGVSLDGEIWMGRGQFQSVAGLSNLKISKHHPQKVVDEQWSRVKFMVFDMPHLDEAYEVRRAELERVVQEIQKKHGRFIEVAPQVELRSMSHLNEVFDTFVAMGAEGVVVRKPASWYETKRSKDMLKMKIHADAEATVTGYVEGDGKYVGKLGSLVCRLNPTVEFHIGTGFTDEMREEYANPKSQHYIPIGATVSFSYMEFTTAGVPRHPVYRGVRTDV